MTGTDKLVREDSTPEPVQRVTYGGQNFSEWGVGGFVKLLANEGYPPVYPQGKPCLDMIVTFKIHINIIRLSSSIYR